MRRLIEATTLFVLIAVVVLRPLIGETYDTASNPINQALGPVGDPTPLRTLVFDLLILCGAGVALGARAISPGRRYRWTGLELGAGLLLVGAVLSCLFAGNKRLAVNAAIDWLCLPVLTIALVQLLGRPRHRQILLAAVLASACVQAAQCLEQRFVGFDETWAHYESIKEDFWAKQGVDLDSAKVAAFERRLHANEASGFLAHSNVAGSYLVLGALAAMGVALAAWTARRRRVELRPSSALRAANARAPGYLTGVAATAGAVLILGAAVSTKSVGAMMAGAVGVMLWMVLHFFGRWIAENRIKAVLIGWVCAVAGVLAVAGYGLSRNALPGWSLTFRWQYWRASSDMIADHLLTGVGRENFGRHYLHYKPIENPEEIANPHNVLVQVATDWGLPGLIGLVTMMVGVSVVLARPCSPRSPPSENGTDAGPERATIVWAAGLTLVVAVGRLPLLGSNDPNYLYYAAVTTGIVWVLGFACFAYSDCSRFGRSLVATGVAIGLFTFLVHDTINFALFVPGSATTFFALLAFCVVERSGEAPSSAEHGPSGASMIAGWLPVAAVIVAIAAVLWLGVLPVTRSSHELALARRAGAQLLPAPLETQLANEYFERAAQLDPLDPMPHVEHATWLVIASGVPHLHDAALGMAVDALENAIHRDPHSIQLRRMETQLHQRSAREIGHPEDYLAAIRSAEEALELYPLDPRGIVTLADRQLEAGEAINSDQLLRDALVNYRRALDLDAARPLWAKLASFRPKEREHIQAQIDQAKRLLES